MVKATGSDILDEIIAGAGGNVENQAQDAISFLDQWSTWIAEFITICKNFFDRISGIFDSAE